jgi:hypothetical protein
MKKIMKPALMISLFALVFLGSCVKNDVTSITLNKSATYLILGQTDSLTTTLKATGDIKNLPQIWTTSNSNVATVVNGLVTGISSGTAIITVKAGNQTATCDVTVDDKILPSMTQGELDYYGDAYSTKDTIKGTGSNNFVVYLASSGIDLNTFQGIGEMMYIEINTPLTVTDSIPAGTYVMMTDLSSLANFKPYTLVPGYTDSSNSQWGCWYFGNISDPVSSGNIVVTKVNTIYTITYEFYDSYGVKISGNYHGTLSYLDNTKPSSVKSTKSRLLLKSLSHLNKTMKFKRK